MQDLQLGQPFKRIEAHNAVVRDIQLFKTMATMVTTAKERKKKKRKEKEVS
jgi:hypothetical protein